MRGGTLGKVLLGLGVLALQSGCSGSVQGGASSADGKQQRRDTRILHEDCDLSDGEKLDANGDSKPDVWLIKKGGREVCRAVDLNFDGKVDAWSYFDESGRVRRRERDYDRDGLVEEISIYSAGSLKEQQRSTALADRLDTWQFFEAGQLKRAERDSDADGVIDQWWEFTQDKCPMIHSDVDGDGRPDPGATIDYCKQTGYVPPTRGGPQTTKHTFERPGTLPEELENKEAPGGAEKAPPKGEKK